MGSRIQRVSRRPRAWAALVFALHLPLLLLGPVLGGMSVLVHEHGGAGRHAHLVAEAAPVAPTERAHLAAHAGEHAHRPHAGHDVEHVARSHPRGTASLADGGHAPPDDHGAPCPTGFWLHLPELQLARSHVSFDAALAEAPASPARWLPFPLAEPAVRARLVRSRDGWPPARTPRTGIAALLATSRAIRV